ncbi:hypothetical protein [Roseitranquillus sediminis]|uniref:hypothetical protein n=1 Tax=Roseitranquillus sediminis TaxID=2809051 RepID=UPI001D0C088E|nr:hypothetical protein [Roseitranquillus sediminis]
MRHLLLGLFLLTAAAPAGASEQLRMLVTRELPRYGYTDVDVRALTIEQVAAIHHALHSDHYSESEKRAMLRSALGGRQSLRGLLSGR